jgi:hypothetical protein
MRVALRHLIQTMEKQDPAKNSANEVMFVYLRGGVQFSVRGIQVLLNGSVEHSKGCFDSEELVAVDWELKDTE